MISKKTLLAVHSWVGLKLSLLMFIVCLTGTFAVISHEIDWLFTEDLRITSQPDSEIDWDAIRTNAHKQFPNRPDMGITKPLYSNFAAIVSMNDPELGARRVFVTNLFDEEVITFNDIAAVDQASGDIFLSGGTNTSILAPRTFGVGVDYSF
jgi:uncharacterized iron-regulated membrane protein